MNEIMKLIDKDALVAEIDRLKDKFSSYPTCSNYDYGVKDGRLIGYDEVLHIIDTLEVKEIGISILNIDDTLKEEGFDPDSKEAKVFKESYYMALEKLKAQKGEEA